MAEANGNKAELSFKEKIYVFWNNCKQLIGLGVKVPDIKTALDELQNVMKKPGTAQEGELHLNKHQLSKIQHPALQKFAAACSVKARTTAPTINIRSRSQSPLLG